MSRIGRQAHRDPRRRRRRGRPWAGHGQGPEGRAHPGGLGRDEGRAGRRAPDRRPADRPRRAPGPARAHPQPDREHGRGRHRRLREAARDPGRRLPRPAAGQHARAGARLSRTRSSVEAPEGIEFEVPQPTEIIVRGIDKQLVGEIAAEIRKRRPPEPYKGKGVRYARRARRPQGRQARMTVLTKPQQTGCAAAAGSAPRSRGTAERPRLSVYRSNRGRLRAADRRRRQGHTVAAVNWTEADLRELEPTRAGQARRRAARRARQARPGSRPASSTAAATATTAASRHSPTAPARGVEALTAV